MADLNKENLANLTPEQAVTDDEVEDVAGGLPQNLRVKSQDPSTFPQSM